MSERINLFVTAETTLYSLRDELVAQLTATLGTDAVKLGLAIIGRLAHDGKITVSTDDLITDIGWVPRDDKERDEMRCRVAELSKLVARIDVIEVAPCPTNLN